MIQKSFQIIAAVSFTLSAAPVDFANLQDRTWVNPGVTIGQTYGASEVSWAYDRFHKKFVRIGGCTGGYTNEVYAYHFNSSGNFVSELVLPPGTQGGDNRPNAGCSRGICYDSKRHIIWGYGGIGAPPIPCSGQNWALMGLDLSDTTWRMAPGSDGFKLGECCQIEYGEYQDVILLVGKDQGSWHQTWLYEFSTGKWRQIGASSASIDLMYKHPCYDADDHAFVMPVGSQTWVFNPSTMSDWEKRDPSPSPSARERWGMAYDPIVQQVVLHGGRGGETDTWAYDAGTNTWTRINDNAGAWTTSPGGIMPFDFDTEHGVFVGYVYGSADNQPVVVFKNQSSEAGVREPVFAQQRGAEWTFPTPLRSPADLRIAGAGKEGALGFYSLQGRLLWQGTAGSRMPLFCPSGNYVLRLLKSEDGRQVRKKILSISK
jgi:hypothetical protein